MSIEQLDSNHTLLPTPASSFRPLDIVAMDMAVPVLTSQVLTHMMTNTMLLILFQQLLVLTKMPVAFD